MIHFVMYALLYKLLHNICENFECDDVHYDLTTPQPATIDIIIIIEWSYHLINLKGTSGVYISLKGSYSINIKLFTKRRTPSRDIQAINIIPLTWTPYG